MVNIKRFIHMIVPAIVDELLNQEDEYEDEIDTYYVEKKSLHWGMKL